MIEKGELWEEPLDPGTPPDLEVHGRDADLARALEPWQDGCPLVRWTPVESAFAASVGLGAGDLRGLQVTCDLLVMSGADQPALNAIVLGAFPPGRFTRDSDIEVNVDGRTVFNGKATTVIVGNGQFIDGADLFRRGHPGDGRAEVMIVGIPAGDRGAFKDRLTSGDATQHPGVHVAAGADITVSSTRPLDGRGDGAWKLPGVRAAEIHVRPSAFRLMI